VRLRRGCSRISPRLRALNDRLQRSRLEVMAKAAKRGRKNKKDTLGRASSGERELLDRPISCCCFGDWIFKALGFLQICSGLPDFQHDTSHRFPDRCLWSFTCFSLVSSMHFLNSRFVTVFLHRFCAPSAFCFCYCPRRSR